MAERRGIQLRGYRRVFQVERRLFRFERWRIPYPHGIPLRGIGYFLVLELLMFASRQLPLLGGLASAFPALIAFAALPLLGAFLLMQARIDGRPPHHVLVSAIGWSLRPRWLAGLSPCPPDGMAVLPLEEVAVAFDHREAFPVAGRIRGPATVTFRYPATVEVEGAPVWHRSERQRARARRYRVRRRVGAEPMRRGKVIGVPRGRMVVIE